MSKNFDILIVGAGPAGSLCAILLARQGYRVAVIAAPRGRGRVEGFSERTVEILAIHGLRHAHAAVGPMVERFASWAGEHGARNREHVTDRSPFDEALLKDLADHDVTALSPDTVSASSKPDSVVVSLRGDNTERHYHAKFFVEARGRAAPAGRDKSLSGPATTAMVRQVDGAVGDARTAVAGFANGWAWFVADGSGPAYLQIFIDSRAGLPKRDALADFFESHVAEIAEKDGWLEGRGFTGPVMAHSSASVLATSPLATRMIRIGDAACALDPLSGNGLFAALSGAAAASPVIHTLIEKSENEDLAKAFYGDRVRDTFDRFSRIGRDFYRLETRWPDTLFWRTRQVWPDDQPAHAAPLSGPVNFTVGPVVEDGLIVEREVCITPDYPRGIWQIDQVPIARLFHILAEYDGRSYQDALPEIQTRLATSARQLKTAVEWLRYRNVLDKSDTIQLRGR
ncbi:MAG: FAD-dependent monooxygenase [Alphaproteobacteria bacterium]